MSTELRGLTYMFTCHRFTVYLSLTTGCWRRRWSVLRFGSGDIVTWVFPVLKQLLTIQEIYTGTKVEFWLISFGLYEGFS